MTMRLRSLSTSSFNTPKPLQESADVTDWINETWFGESGTYDSLSKRRDRQNRKAYLEEGWDRWFFGKCPDLDNVQRNSTHVIRQQQNMPSSVSSRSALAKIISLDQFSRCAFRGTQDAFAFEQDAQTTALNILENGWFDTKYTPVERFFCSFPFRHAEDRELQRIGEQLLNRICDEDTPDEVKHFFDNLIPQLAEHRNVVMRFGRFPHRNRVLDRDSTPDEIAWLEQPDVPGWARSQDRPSLMYWDTRGLGEPVRVILEATGVSYDEDIVRTRDEFLRARDEKDSSLGLGQVPRLAIDNMNLVESSSIVRYLARRFNVEGSTATEIARADIVATFVASVRFPLITLRFQDDPSLLNSDLLPNFLSRLERFLRDVDGGFGVAGGTMLTYADFLLVDLLKHAEDESISMDLDLYPRVAKIYDSALKHDRLASYLESPRRRPIPDGAKVKEICNILDIPIPKYLLLES